MKIHLMGIGGSGMKGIALLAEKMGYEVTGCDLKEDGHSVSHLKEVDLLLISPAVLYQNKKHPELIEGLKRNIVMTWQEFLGEVLLKDKKVIAVAGTHGKSTTTAMISKLLIDSGFDPICMVGANVPEWNGNTRFGNGEWAVIEADEFNNNFLHYNPEIAIITNIEFDHPDYFKNENDVKKSFKKFITKSHLVIDSTRLHLADTKKIKLKIFGDHNQKNANLAYRLGRKLGISDEKIIRSLENFNGIGRRMELIGKTKSGALIYDDYAHHPTAIKATLKGLREKYPNKKILAIIEPHGYKRTKALMPRYKNAFDSVDSVIIGPIFKARDNVDKSLSLSLLAKISGHKNIRVFQKLDDLFRISNRQHRNAREFRIYDVIVIMGAGESNIWARKIADAINGPRPKTFRELTTFRTGGVIKHYFEVKNDDEIASAVKFAKVNNLPIFIIGGGSDILVSDDDFEGVVLKIKNQKLKIKDNAITADAGLEWDSVVQIAVENDLQGIECLSGIPGTVGGAPIQNIGAYGQELKDSFSSLRAYDIEKEKFVMFSNKDCKFGYRTSVFKNKKYWQKFVITDVTLKLQKNKKPVISYNSLLKKLKNPKNPKLKEVRDAVIETRAKILEDWQKMPNAGSYFKNPVVKLKIKNKILKMYKDARIYPFGDDFKIAAGWMIEKAGWKGKSLGKASVSGLHSLILTNPGGKGTTKDILNLAKAIKKDVLKMFGVNLEPEVQYIDFK